MSEHMVIQSSKGPYTVAFEDGFSAWEDRLTECEPHFILDDNVARLHEAALRRILSRRDATVIEATEENKTIERVIPVYERLVGDGIRRDHVLIAIGGGVIQDITCFVASTLLRGVRWRFVPTTLLAQADSCIGSKSSINLGATKNLLGGFYPPEKVLVCREFLETLEEKDIRSGIGEIIKVHAIEGIAAFERLASDFDRLFSDPAVLQRYIRAALLIKQPFIEADEFDRGVRNIFNYGHSFGHAIESATNYAIPHGIAVTLGMDMANHIAVRRELLPVHHCRRMRTLLRANCGMYLGIPIQLDPVLSALARDKKNTSTKLRVILPVGDKVELQRVEIANDETFRTQCGEFLAELGK